MFDTKEIADLFGFDLGDGESAVAWMRAGSPVAPQMLERHPELAAKHVASWLGGKSDYLKA